MSSFDGTWHIAIKTPMGDEESVLAVTSEDGVLSGTQTAHDSTSPIFDGSIDGTAVRWAVELTKPWKFTLKFRGEIDGDKVSGRVKPGIFPETSFFGKR
jgi:hypothetical protein